LNSKILILLGLLCLFALAISSCDDSFGIEDNRKEYPLIEYESSLSQDVVKLRKPKDSVKIEPHETTFIPDAIRPEFYERYTNRTPPFSQYPPFYFADIDIRDEILIDTADNKLRIKFDLFYDLTPIFFKFPSWKKEYLSRVTITTNGKFVNVPKNQVEPFDDYSIDMVLTNINDDDGMKNYYSNSDLVRGVQIIGSQLNDGSDANVIIIDLYTGMPYIQTVGRDLLVRSYIKFYF
jgi:hypothetical protein